MIAPQVYAVAGHLGGGRVLAVVVTFGYAAFLIGPAVVGFLVSRLGIQHAMAVPALLCVGIVALAAHHAEAGRRPRTGPGRTAIRASRTRSAAQDATATSVRDEVDRSSRPGGGSGPTWT